MLAAALCALALSPAVASAGERSGPAAADRLVGTVRDDRLSGGAGDDRLQGRAGDDRLQGRAGDDRLSGGGDDDRLSGGGDDDRLSGGTGRDRLHGGSGDDVLDGGAGPDVLHCGGGRDRVVADADDGVAAGCERVVPRSRAAATAEPGPERPEPPGESPAPAPTPAPSATPTPAPEDTSVPLASARSAGAFLDTIGVNVHMNYNGTPYYEQPQRLAEELSAIGVRHVRDGHQGRRQDQFDRLNVLADAGMGITLLEDPRSDPLLDGDRPVRRWDDPSAGGHTPEDPNRWGAASLLERMHELRDGKIRNVVALEGPNEYDLERDFGDYQWLPTVARFQCRMKALRDAYVPGVELIGPSFTKWEAYEAARHQGWIAGCQDTGAIHPYPGGGPPTTAGRPVTLSWHLDEMIERLSGVDGSAWAATETGYHNADNWHGDHPPVPEAEAAVYAPKLFLEYFRQGTRRTFWYEAVDQWPNPAGDWLEDHFGLLRNDLSWKPAAHALRNLIAAVSRPGPAGDGSLRYSLQAAPGVQHVLLRLGDGSFALLLWQDVSVWDAAARTPLSSPATVVNLRLGSAADLRTTSVATGAAGPVATADALAIEVPADDTVVVSIG